MDTQEIIAQIDFEIARLQQAKTLLSGTTAANHTAHKKLGRPAKARLTIAAPIAAKRTMSPEGRARIAAAQKARWAKQRKSTKKAA
jgi:hypothetical protein